MSHIRLTQEALSDLARLHAFLAKFDLHTANSAMQVIESAFRLLRDMPLSCPLVPSRTDLRKLVINFGARGYLAFYEYDAITDTCVIATVLHQSEFYDKANVGLHDE